MSVKNKMIPRKEHYFFNKAKGFARQSFSKTTHGKVHYRYLCRSVHWLEKICDNPDELQKIACMLHNINIAAGLPSASIFLSSIASFSVPSSNIPSSKTLSSSFGYGLPSLNSDPKESAILAKKYLKSISLDKFSINDVVDIVLNHQLGGTRRRNFVKDAIIIAFFENYTELIAKETDINKSEIASIYNMMYRSISSIRANNIVEPKYFDSMQILYNLETT